MLRLLSCSARTEVERRMVDSRKVKVDFSLEDMDLSKFKGKATYEQIKVDQLFGHGGYFKTKGVGQRIAAAAMNASVSVMETAGEGGAWGIAVLAAFLAKKKDGQSLGEFLNEEIFAGNKGVKMDPMAEDVEGFEKFMEKYMKNLPAEKAAVEAL